MKDYKQKYKDLLKKFEQYKLESLKWSVEDFLEYVVSYKNDEPVYWEMSNQQAQDALEDMICNHDASKGIDYNTIEYYGNKHSRGKTKKTMLTPQHNSAEDLMRRINFQMLKQQKEDLINIRSEVLSKEQKDSLKGILNLLDSIQDYAVDVLGMDEFEVFNITNDNE